MTKGERYLLAKLIEDAADILGNRGCNDTEASYFELLSPKERRQLAKEYEEWNGSPEEYRGDWDISRYPDFAIMRFLAHRLLQEDWA